MSTNTSSTALPVDTSGSLSGIVDSPLQNRSVTSSSGNYVAPFIASLNADASGTVGVLETQQVSITGIDNAFSILVTNGQAARLLNAFRITDADLSGGQYADVTVTMDPSGQANFLSALTTILSSADLKDSSNNSLYSWLKAEARADTVLMLSYDRLANLLEATDLLTFDIAIDASGGASDLYTKMSATDSTTNNRREALFRQIDRTEIEAYLTASTDGIAASLEGVTTLRFLPLKKGSKLTFVFDATVGDYTVKPASPVDGARITAVSSSINAVSSTSQSTVPTGTINVTNTGLIQTSNPALIYSTPSRRRIAVTITLGSPGTGANPSTTFNTTGQLNTLPQLDPSQT